MTELDPVFDARERLEWDDARRDDGDPRSRVAAITRRSALTGGAAGVVATMLAACGGGGGPSPTTAAPTGGGGNAAVFGSPKKLKFVLVNHVTTNPFFVPTKYGAEDACKLLGCSYQWTGSENANVNEMANAMNTAITGGANGIGVCLVDKKAFNAPTDAALKAKIPVVAYNADEPNNRLCYIGQDLFLSGQEMGKKIVDLVPSGDVALFIATPGASNIQPRIDGALDVIKKSGKGITPHTVATGAAVPAEHIRPAYGRARGYAARARSGSSSPSAISSAMQG
jgi:simple sugar transport system substrate-binding protein